MLSSPICYVSWLCSLFIVLENRLQKAHSHVPAKTRKLNPGVISTTDVSPTCLINNGNTVWTSWALLDVQFQTILAQRRGFQREERWKAIRRLVWPALFQVTMAERRSCGFLFCTRHILSLNVCPSSESNTSSVAHSEVSFIFPCYKVFSVRASEDRRCLSLHKFYSPLRPCDCHFGLYNQNQLDYFVRHWAPIARIVARITVVLKTSRSAKWTVNQWIITTVHN